MVNFFKADGRLVFLDAELADAVIHMNHGVAQGVRRHVEPVVRSAVALVDDTAVVRLKRGEKNGYLRVVANDVQQTRNLFRS